MLRSRPWQGCCTPRRVRDAHGGQSLVEAAIVLPFLILLVLGTVDVGRAFAQHEVITNAARDAGRVAVLHETAGDQACQSGDLNTSTKTATAAVVLPAESGDPVLTQGGNGYVITAAAELESSSNGTVGATGLSNATLTVTWNCTQQSDGSGTLTWVAVTNSSALSASSTDPNGSGSATVIVKLSESYVPITPLASKIGEPTMSSTLYMRVQY